MSLAADFSERQSPIIGYGLSNGAIGVVELMRNKSMTLWSLEPMQIQGGNCAPVSIVKTCKLGKKLNIPNQKNTDEPFYDLIVARDDGLIEIYAY